MEPFIDLCVSFPVVIFTALLAFALAWWIVTTLAGGLDSDGGADSDGDGLIDDLSDALGAAGVPTSIALSLLAFAGWVTALIGTAAVQSLSTEATVGIGIAIAIVVASLAVGVVFLRFAARPLRPLFVTEVAPSIDGVIGAFAKVRSPRLDLHGGEVIVTSGPLRTTVLRARSQDRFAAGDDVHVIARDDDGRYVVCAIDDALT